MSATYPYVSGAFDSSTPAGFDLTRRRRQDYRPWVERFRSSVRLLLIGCKALSGVLWYHTHNLMEAFPVAHTFRVASFVTAARKFQNSRRAL